MNGYAPRAELSARGTMLIKFTIFLLETMATGVELRSDKDPDWRGVKIVAKSRRRSLFGG
jgi:hypothetical protein